MPSRRLWMLTLTVITLINRQPAAAQDKKIERQLTLSLQNKVLSLRSALPFVKVGFAIYAASIVATDDTIKKNPDLTRRFLKAIRRSFEWAKANPEEACRLHIQKNPEVALDDCTHSVEAVMSFVFTDHEEKYGFGKESPERLAFTFQAVAEAQEIDPKWDYKQMIDTSLVPPK